MLSSKLYVWEDPQLYVDSELRPVFRRPVKWENQGKGLKSKGSKIELIDGPILSK